MSCGDGFPAAWTAFYADEAGVRTHYLAKSWSGPQPDLVFDLMNGTAEAWGVPLFLGELGAPAETINGDIYINSLYRHLDDEFSSGAQWVYTPGWTPEAKDGWNAEDFSVVDDRGAARPNFRPRPSPRRIAGTPLALHVTFGEDLRTNLFELEWDHDPKTGETEIFMPSEAFFGSPGATIEATGDGLACEKPQRSLVKCSAPIGGKKRVVLRAPSVSPAEPSGCSSARSPNQPSAAWISLLGLALSARRTLRRASTSP